MHNKKRGYLDLEIGGKKRTLHFSMNFWSEFTDALNLPLDKLGEAFEKGVTIKMIIQIVYCGLYAYDMENKNKIDYNAFDVGNWLEEVNAEKLTDITNSLMESKILGNQLNMGIDRNPTEEKKTITSQQKLAGIP